MRNIQPISALLVGTVSAAIYGGVTVLCGPPILFFLTAGSLPGLDADPIDGWVTLAVFAPLMSGAIGFFSGLFMASFWNFLVVQVLKPKPSVVAMSRVIGEAHAESRDDSDFSRRPGIRLMRKGTSTG